MGDNNVADIRLKLSNDWRFSNGICDFVRCLLGIENINNKKGWFLIVCAGTHCDNIVAGLYIFSIFLWYYAVKIRVF